MAADDRVDVVDDKKLKKEKKSKDKSDKKDKKRSDDGVRKPEKKDKKKDKAKQDKLARALDAHLQADAAAAFDAEDDQPEVDPEDLIKPAEELVPFALPLADDKTHKKIYKLIKKGASAELSLRVHQLNAKQKEKTQLTVPFSQAPSSSRSTAA